MDDLTIVGSSGAVAEVVGIARALERPVSRIVGSGKALEVAPDLGLDAVAREEATLDGPTAVVVGSPAERSQLFDQIAAAGGEAVTLVHPAATVGPGVTLGRGCIVAPGVRITANVSIGVGCLLHAAVVLSHDDVIGDFVTISPSATLTGGVTVELGVFIGAGATILPGVTIGAGASVGGGALVRRDVDAGTTVAGVPAKPLG